MLHAVIMRPDKFKTACEIRFIGMLLKGKKFKHLTREELDSIQCDICKEKVISLRSKTGGMFQGGRSILIDLEVEK